MWSYIVANGLAGLPPPVVPDGTDQGEPAMVVCASPNACLVKLPLSFVFSMRECVVMPWVFEARIQALLVVHGSALELVFVFSPQHVNALKFVFL